MPDIFISYNREDRDTARLFAGALEAEGLSVWWDAALRAGETYDEVTEQNLRTAGAVVVLWSKRSANSKWVRAEATVGERNSTLVPALIEDCERPIRFELVQTADLRHWRGDRADPHWRAFMQDVKLAVSRRAAKPQPTVAAAPAHDASIETAFWNSIKDGKDRAEFEAYLKRYPSGNFVALAQNRLAALSRAAAPAQPTSRPQAPQQRPPQPQARPAAAAPQPAKAPAPEPKKSGSGLLIAGVVVGLGVIAGVGYMLMRGDSGAGSAAPPSAIVAQADEPAPATETATETAEEIAQTAVDAPATDSATTETIIAETEAAPVEEEVAAVEEAAPQPNPLAPFKDCESCPLMAPLAGGVFQMGSPKDEPGRNAYEGPQRDVTVKPFAIGVYEVTTGEWSACVEDGACAAKRTDETGKMPALSLSWRDATAYASWLTKKTGRKYRLPTEAEWEYAARAGSTSAYWWGASFDRSRVAASEASPVGSYGANAFGLYDVLGNAREWVADCYVNNYVNAPADGSAVTDGDCGRRVVRGGAWSSPPADMRTANRSRIDIDVSASYMGARLAAELDK
ncbi:MAG: SUMF1/EgtB/PvdO family nonheme iron enzyme [Parvularculaceae bacterium]